MRARTGCYPCGFDVDDGGERGKGKMKGEETADGVGGSGREREELVRLRSLYYCPEYQPRLFFFSFFEFFKKFRPADQPADFLVVFTLSAPVYSTTLRHF